MGSSQVVWVVESGHYSDRGIEAVFSSEEEARAYIEYALQQSGSWKDDYHCNRWEVDPAFKVEGVIWEVWVDGDGAMTVEPSYRSKEQPMDLYAFSDAWEGWVRARDEEHARKIAGEQIARAKAEQAGMR